MFYRFLIAAILIVFSNKAYTQVVYYPYYTSDTVICVKLADQCKKRIEESFVLPEKISKNYRKDFLNTKIGSSTYTRSLVRYTMLPDDVLNPFIQSVYKKIVEGNPELTGYTIVVSDCPTMNAANYGGKVVIFNAPLLSRLKSEGEVAAVLCHELAHGELDHIQNGLKKRLDDFYDKNFQKEIKAAIKEEFNVYAKVSILKLKFAFGSSYHSRLSEKSADSLGFIFLSKTSYNVNDFTSLLESLKHVDEPVVSTSFDYEKYFKCENVKFDFASIQPYKKSSIFSSPENSDLDTLVDSLRTHPDCDKRINSIRDLMKKYGSKQTPVTVKSNFEDVKWAAAMEMIQAYYVYEYYDYALFNALSYLELRPGDEYLKTIVSLTLSGLYKAMKDHELSDYISNYSEGNTIAFNDFLFFINNLRLNELNSFINCFYQKNVASINENEFYIAASYFCSVMNEDGKSKTWQEKYKTLYNKGRFYYLMGLNPKPGKKKKK